MDRLQRSCDASDTYPLNLEGPSTGLFYLRHERELLRKISPRTFADETKAHLDFWEYQQDDFSLTPIKSQQCLRDHLNRLNQAQDYAPLHRFVFIQASSSRTKLLISEDMLKDLLSYFQVMAALIPLLASFGIDAGEDFQHCQFESNVKLSSNELGLAVPELKRSGRTIEIAYVFRTVEPSKSIEGIPWQIKQTCVYHSFDVETGLNTWIFVKGSDLVKNRVMDGLCLPSADTSPVEAFLFSLSVQSMLSNLSLENWRTYVNSLEQKAQIVTTALTFKPVEIPETPIAPAMIAQHGAITPLGFRGRSRSLIYNQLSRSSTLKSWMSRKEMSTPVLSLDMTLAMTDLTAAQTVPPSGQSRQSEDDEERTYFKCLQDMKWLEEQALEALLVLKMTVRMWKQLQRTYEENVTDEHFPHSLRHGCRRGLKQFLSRLDNVEDALENQVLRVEALIALLSGRKNLVICTCPLTPTATDECLASQYPRMAQCEGWK